MLLLAERGFAVLQGKRPASLQLATLVPLPLLMLGQVADVYAGPFAASLLAPLARLVAPVTSSAMLPLMRLATAGKELG